MGPRTGSRCRHSLMDRSWSRTGAMASTRPTEPVSSLEPTNLNHERDAHMLRRVLSIVAATSVLLIGIRATPLSQAPPRTTASASLDEKLSSAVTRGDVPGVVAVAATRDRILYQGAFGKADVAGGRPMSADALFRIASMTKAVTSVAAMQLFEQGRFTLDDPAERYLPELANLKVFESFDQATGAYKVHPASLHAHIRSRIRVHQSDRSRFQAARGRNLSSGPVALRAGDAVDLWDERRLARAAGREALREKPRGVLPRTHLHAAEDVRYVLQRPRDQAGAAGDGPPASRWSRRCAAR